MYMIIHHKIYHQDINMIQILILNLCHLYMININLNQLLNMLNKVQNKLCIKLIQKRHNNHHNIHIIHWKYIDNLSSNIQHKMMRINIDCIKLDNLYINYFLYINSLNKHILKLTKQRQVYKKYILIQKHMLHIQEDKVYMNQCLYENIEMLNNLPKKILDLLLHKYYSMMNNHINQYIQNNMVYNNVL